MKLILEQEIKMTFDNFFDDEFEGDRNPTHEEEAFERYLAGKAYFDKSNTIVSCDENILDLIKYGQIALRRFPELQERESISVIEIKKRLGELRIAGYGVKHYSKMNKTEAWNYLREIRGKIANELNIKCPEILKKITLENQLHK
jgi:hypothetical protein